MFTAPPGETGLFWGVFDVCVRCIEISSRHSWNISFQHQQNNMEPKTCGRRSRPSQATKAGVHPPCVARWTSFMLVLTSSTKSQLSNPLLLTSHCQYPQQMWEEPFWEWMWAKLLGLITSLCPFWWSTLRTGFPAQQRKHSSQPGPSLVCIKAKRSTGDAISTAFHSVFTHLENNNRMLFVDFSSAFNTISPMKLIGKLSTLGLSTIHCNWILDFLINRPQKVRSGAPRQSPPGMCTQPPLVPAVNRQLQFLTWRELCCEVCGWHHHHRLDFKQQWAFIFLRKCTILQSGVQRTTYCSFVSD